jgi:hypothetical protein
VDGWAVAWMDGWTDGCENLYMHIDQLHARHGTKLYASGLVDTDQIVRSSDRGLGEAIGCIEHFCDSEVPELDDLLTSSEKNIL